LTCAEEGIHFNFLVDGTWSHLALIHQRDK